MSAAVSADARDGARFMGAYSRRYAAGAFATPTAQEIEQLEASPNGEWIDLPAPGRVAWAARRLTRDSFRTDYTGRRYGLPAGSTVITHLAADEGAELPVIRGYDFVYAYLDDRNVTGQLQAQGRELYAVKVAASSELIGCWAQPGNGYRYSPVDRATLTELPLDATRIDRVAAEVDSVEGWHDDFPYYSDGSWGALSLRGFDPDPQWGIKPSEMGRRWLDEHPGALERRCGWTTLAERLPATVDLVTQITDGWGPLERVRLLRMAGRDGKGGNLNRHSDVTDRDSGTRNGQIVRFHVPIVTDPRITMTAWPLDGRPRAVHLPAWTLWYLDARKPHAVSNRAGIDRVHLVIDVEANDAVRAAIEAGHDHAA